MTTRRIIVLEGDQTGQELLEESLRVLSPEATRVPVEFARYDLSSVFEAVFEGVKTADLGGHATTSEFTDEVIRRVKSKLEVWSALA